MTRSNSPRSKSVNSAKNAEPLEPNGDLIPSRIIPLPAVRGPGELIPVCDARGYCYPATSEFAEKLSRVIVMLRFTTLPLRTGVLRGLLLPVPLSPCELRGLRLAWLLVHHTKEHPSLDVIRLPVVGQGAAVGAFSSCSGSLCALQLPERATWIHKSLNSRGRDLKEHVSQALTYTKCVSRRRYDSALESLLAVGTCAVSQRGFSPQT
jgi:hypothetical protein